MFWKSSLRRRIIASFVAITTLVCLLFSTLVFAFAYSIEDSLLEEGLRAEATQQQTHWQAVGGLSVAGHGGIDVHLSPDTFPADLRAAFVQEPGRREYTGTDGRHYHVLAFPLPASEQMAYAVTEVSSRLVVRPIFDKMLNFLIGCSLAALLLTALVGHWLARRATAPLERLAGSMSSLVGGQIPQIDVQAFPGNEIGVLALALSDAFDRIRAFLDREKAFTRDASHELRTPLAVIRGATEILEAQADLPARPRQTLHRIAHAAREMQQTIELLLSLAREEAVAAPPGPVRLLAVIEASVLGVGDRFAPGNQVRIDVPERVELRIDDAILARILDNLLTNAFQHAPNGTVTIRFAAPGTLMIADDGPGIPDQIQVGTPFSKGSNSPGWGLGLSIVHRLCERAGICLTVENVQPTGTLIQLNDLPVLAEHP